jgi:hypothetical protein
MGNQVDHVTHGIAYGEVTTTKMSTAQDYSFGITSDKIYVNPNKGYYGSVAVRPKPGTGAAGFYKLEVDAFDENDVLMQTFDNLLSLKKTTFFQAILLLSQQLLLLLLQLEMMACYFWVR